MTTPQSLDALEDDEMEAEGRAKYWIDSEEWDQLVPDKVLDFYRADIASLKKAEVQVSHPFGLDRNILLCRFDDITRKTPVRVGDSRTYRAESLACSSDLAVVIQHLLEQAERFLQATTDTF